MRARLMLTILAAAAATGRVLGAVTLRRLRAPGGPRRGRACARRHERAPRAGRLRSERAGAREGGRSGHQRAWGG
jgi:hypothetical protein